MKEISEGFYIEVKKILLAHECLWQRGQRTNCRDGRRMHGVTVACEGSATYVFDDGERVTLSAHQVLLLPAGCKYEATANAEYRHYTVNFLAGEAGPLLDIGNCLTVNASPQMISLFSSASRAWAKKSFGFEMNAAACLYSLLSLIFEEQGRLRQMQDADYSRLIVAKEYIERSFTRPMNIRELSSLCNMSETGFRRSFKRVFGEPPMGYRDRLRILYAKDLLSAGIYEVGEVARRAGFGDEGYFCRNFKRHTGISPGKYSKIQR